MCENAGLADLVDHFGRDNALRIYACGMLLAQSCEKAHGDVSVGVRIAIGALKRIRRHGGYQLISWADAIEKLETEQDEGRHYGLTTKSATMIEVARIEAINGSSYTSIMHGVIQEVDSVTDKRQSTKDIQDTAIAMIRTTIINAHTDYATNTQEQTETREWVQQYWHSVSKTKRTYLHSVISTYSARQAISEDVRKNLSNRYAPKGVKPMEFIELLARYVYA